MRKFLPVLLFIVVGCQNCPRIFECSPSCVDMQSERDCPSEENLECPQKRGARQEKQCQAPSRVCLPEEKSAVLADCKQPEVIHVNLPRQKIVVHHQETGQQAMTQQAYTPQPQPIMSQAQQQMVMVPMAQTQGFGAPAGGARPGLTFDFFRLPIPFLRLIAVPDAAPQMQAVAVAQAVQPQMVAMQPQMVQPQMVAMQPQMVQPHMVQQVQPHMVQQVQSHATVPVQGHAVVPVQGHAVVPVQSHAVVPMQAHAAYAAQSQGAIPVQTQGVAVQPQTLGQPQTQQMTLEQARELCRMLKELEDAGKR